MRYVSTRGRAPALDFEGAMLAGLARDGGLYVPEAWPRMTPRGVTRAYTVARVPDNDSCLRPSKNPDP